MKSRVILISNDQMSAQTWKASVHLCKCAYFGSLIDNSLSRWKKKKNKREYSVVAIHLFIEMQMNLLPLFVFIGSFVLILVFVYLLCTFQFQVFKWKKWHANCVIVFKYYCFWFDLILIWLTPMERAQCICASSIKMFKNNYGNLQWNCIAVCLYSVHEDCSDFWTYNSIAL